ncbi:hypothetical protein ACFSQP_07340 [Bizionia sediminis]|uniref:GLPGLI family protein n=1 Tax=Bizionia sediminis TaxID=1737064 RepID=A0ABW5KSR4_9FLAO
MGRHFILLLMGFITHINFGQSNTLYLLIDKPYFGYSFEENIGTGFAIVSNDKDFSTDYYGFDIQNVKGFKKTGEFDYYTLKELRKEIDIDTVKLETIKSFSENKEWWQIHNELSLKRKIFLIEKREGAFNTSTGKYEITYYMLPMIYEGTRKNVVPTDLSN